MTGSIDGYEDLVADSPPVTEAYDTATPPFADYAERVAERLDSRADSTTGIDAQVRAVAPEAVGLRIALKLAESARVIEALSEPVTVTVVEPVYKETARMAPRDQHPHGEDSVRFKSRALQDLARRNPNFRPRLVVVDDECPEGSGRLAQRILDAEPDPVDHEVLFLSDALDAKDPDLPVGLTHKDGDNGSVKGGAVLYAFRRSLRQETSGRHVLVDTDADLSIGPGQLGLLLDGIVNDGLGVVAGSRREPDSVAIIGAGRAERGAQFIEVWQKLLPQLAEHVTDTNRAFKAFAADKLATFVDDVRTYTFPYQIELLLTALLADVALGARAIAYVDSEAASTQREGAVTETYLHQMKQIALMAQRHGTIEPDDPLATFILGADEADLTADALASIERGRAG